MHRMGCAEGRSPFAGGTGVSPVFGVITPFLARKGDGRMVERAEEHRLHKRGAWGFEAKPHGCGRGASGAAVEVEEIDDVAREHQMFVVLGDLEERFLDDLP